MRSEVKYEISKEECESLLVTIQNKPIDTFESVYELKESGMYEARERTHEEVIDWYVQIVLIGTITLEDVPEEYRSEVESLLTPVEPEALYTLDEACEIITQEVASDEV